MQSTAQRFLSSVWGLWSVLIACTGLSFYFGGYIVFSADHLLYVPYFLHALNPGLYASNDMVVGYNQGAWTFFGDLFKQLMRIPRPYVFYALFALMCVFRILFFYALYRIAKFFAHDAFTARFIPFVFVSGLLVYATATSTLDMEFVPRVIALPLGLLAIAYCMERNTLAAYALAAVALLIHPISALIPLGVLYVDFLYNLYNRSLTKADWWALLPFAALALLTLVKPFPEGSAFFMDSTWRAILIERDTFSFVTAWWGFGTTLLFDLFLDMAALWYLRGRLFQKGSRQAYFYDLLAFVPLCALVGSVITVDMLSIHLVAEFEILRILMLWKILLPICFVLYLVRSSDASRTKLFLLAGIVSSFLIKETVIFAFLPALFLYELAPRLKAFLAISFAAFVSVGLLLISVLHIKTEPNLVLGVVLVWCTAIIATYAIIKRQVTPFILAGALAAALLCVIIISVNSFSYLTPSWSHDADVLQACAWLDAHSKPNDVILTEPFSNVPYIRVACLRSPYSTDKDGAASLFSRAYALEWQRRQEVVAAIAQDPRKAADLASLSVGFILADSSYQLPFTEVYRNASYHIYKLP